MNCPLCSSSGYPGLIGFSCNNRKCRNHSTGTSYVEPPVRKVAMFNLMGSIFYGLTERLTEKDVGQYVYLWLERTTLINLPAEVICVDPYYTGLFIRRLEMKPTEEEKAGFLGPAEMVKLYQVREA